MSVYCLFIVWLVFVLCVLLLLLSYCSHRDLFLGSLLFSIFELLLLLAHSSLRLFITKSFLALPTNHSFCICVFLRGDFLVTFLSFDLQSEFFPTYVPRLALPFHRQDTLFLLQINARQKIGRKCF